MKFVPFLAFWASTCTSELDVEPESSAVCMLQGAFLGSRLHSEEATAREEQRNQDAELLLGEEEATAQPLLGESSSSTLDPKALVNGSKDCIALALPRLLYVVGGILHVAIVGDNGDLLEEFVAEGETPNFGRSCFVYQTEILVGTPNDGVYMYSRGDLPSAWAGPTAPSDSGQVASPWSLSRKITVPSDAFDSDFGWSVWTQGHYVAVGAPLLGRTYVMDGKTGAVVDTLPSGGWDLSGSNGVLALADPVRPPSTDPTAGNGMVLLVRAEQSPWVPIGEIPSIEPDSLFGFRIALFEQTLVVAAPIVAAVYIFQDVGHGFALASTLKHDDPRAKFGNAVALSDDLLLVSDLVSPTDGHVYAYELGEEDVGESLDAPEGHRENYAFWRGLAMDADIIAAGGYNLDDNGEYKVQLYGWSRRRTERIPTPLPTMHTTSLTPDTTSTTEAPPSTVATTAPTTTASVPTTRLSTTTSTTTSMTALPTNFTGVANPAQDCKAEPIASDKAFCHKDGKVFRWVGMGAEVGVGCSMDPSEDCCGKFVAEVIACCKEAPGFSLEAYISLFKDFSCQVLEQTDFDPVTNTTSEGEKAGDLFPDTRDAPSGHQCSFMDLMLECPSYLPA